MQPSSDGRTYADSAATSHCFHSPLSFVTASLRKCPTRTVLLANNEKVKVKSWGDVRIEFDDAIIRLKKVLYVPKLGYNLVSTGKLADNGIESEFRRHDLKLKLEGSGKTIGNGSRDQKTGLYVLPSACIKNETVMLCMGPATIPSA